MSTITTLWGGAPVWRGTVIVAGVFTVLAVIFPPTVPGLMGSAGNSSGGMYTPPAMPTPSPTSAASGPPPMAVPPGTPIQVTTPAVPKLIPSRALPDDAGVGAAPFIDDHATFSGPEGSALKPSRALPED